MKRIGFLKSIKENEKRIALLPEEIKFIKNKEYLFFEEGYGIDLGIEDCEYEKIGCNIENRKSILDKDIICDPKIGDSVDLKLIHNKIIFGWVHAVQNRDITDILINNNLTAYAWEDMFEDGRHVFWKNNELAGEAGIMHCFLCTGILPLGFKAAVLGNGNTARGALKMLTKLGVQVDVYTRKMENLFRKNMYQYDIIVNAILWDTKRKDHIIYKSDLKKLKNGIIIIDISCDKNGAIETSIPTTIDNPIYEIDNVIHYVVDHTPSLIYKTTSKAISKALYKYIDYLIEEKHNTTIEDSLIVKNCEIVDKRIKEFQNR